LPVSHPPALESLNVREFLNQPNDVRTAEGLYVFDSEIKAELEYAWKIAKAAVGMQIRGHLEGKFHPTCDWCHQSFDKPVAMVVEETYVIQSYANYDLSASVSGKEKELQPDDFYEVIEEDANVDLKDLASQYLLIETSGPQRCSREDCHPDE